MFMGQKYAKEAKLTFKSSSSKKTKQNSDNNKETGGAVHFSIHQGTSTTATATTLSVPAAAVGTQANDLKTGNLVIAIRMLTMNPNDTTTTTTVNTAPTGSGDDTCRVEDDTSNNNNNNNEIFDHSSASVIDVLDIINSSSSSSSSSSSNSSSKDSQSNSTLQSSSSVSDTCSESSDVCDTLQNTVSPTFINLTAQQPQATTAAAHSISASCSSCAGNSSLADKLNSMLSSSRCKVQGASVPLSQGCSTKVKAKKSNWSLGKLTGLSKREKKKQQLVSCPEEKDHGIEKTDVPCYWLNGVGVGVGDDNNHIPEPMVINSSELPSIPTPTTTTATVQSNSVKYPRAQPLPLINGTLPPATSSTAQAAAATFIYPDPNRAATTATPTPGVATTTPTPTTFLHSRATLYGSLSNGTSGGNFFILSPFIDTRTVVTQEDYSLEDLDEQLRWRRALQIAEGIEAPPGFIPRSEPVPQSTLGTPIWQTVVTDAASLQSFIGHISKLSLSPEEVIPRGIHSQADYIHCLVPDLEKIINCNFYWGKMDRFEAEKLLDGKPEGTFLLRDSAQEDFLFSVSFRKYGRSLHARVEQFNHEFSFDSHDPGVHTAKTVTGLLEHYKDPSCVMFFEPMLTSPLNRNFVFSLQELARATIVSKTTYDDIDKLGLPKKLCFYMREYHYRQRVHVKRFDGWDS